MTKKPAMLFLRTTDAEGRTYRGFQWPRKVGAIVKAPDWNPESVCGGGLHGLRDGLGEASCLDWSADALWWVVEATDGVECGGKWKFPHCKVLFVGDRQGATSFLHERRPGPIHGLSISTGYRGTVRAGYRGTARAGDWGTAQAGYKGTAQAGDWGTLIFTRWLNGRKRVLVAYVGENGVKADTPYRANADHTDVEEIK